jgi:hypothetical protein
MRRSKWRAIAVLLVIGVAGVAAGRPNESALRKNIGLILDTPFLHQDELPYESEFYGPYGDERIAYEYNADGLPVFIRYAALDTDATYLDTEVSYRPDGHIEALTYFSYDDAGEEIIYVDRFDFSEYTRYGPRLGTMITEEGIAAEMRLTYDDEGRLIGLEEDDAFGTGLFRVERYAWVEREDGSLPYAIEIRFPLDGEIERYRYLYDARDRLVSLDGFNALTADPDDRTTVDEWYAYRTGTLEEIFGRITPGGGTSTTASR